MSTVHRCSCGREVDLAGWLARPFCGLMDDGDGGTLELRTCDCRSTGAVDVKTLAASGLGSTGRVRFVTSPRLEGRSAGADVVAHGEPGVGAANYADDLDDDISDDRRDFADECAREAREEEEREWLERGW